MREREATIQEFHTSSPHFSEYEGEMEHYEQLEAEITELPASQYLNAAIQLSTGQPLLHLARLSLLRCCVHLFIVGPLCTHCLPCTKVV